MDVGILARRVHVEAMMGMLDGRNRQAAGNQAGDNLRQQSGLPRPAPAGQSDDAHGPYIAPSRFSGRVGGSFPCHPIRAQRARIITFDAAPLRSSPDLRGNVKAAATTCERPTEGSEGRSSEPQSFVW